MKKEIFNILTDILIIRASGRTNMFAVYRICYLLTNVMNKSKSSKWLQKHEKEWIEMALGMPVTVDSISINRKEMSKLMVKADAIYKKEWENKFKDVPFFDDEPNLSCFTN